jgi:hypothetical protein
MPTEIVCTVCGARQPLVAALDAPATAAAWEAALALWGESVPGAAAVTARYLDWFAQPAKAPQARTVTRVLEDLAARIAVGTVSSKGVSRPAPLAAWIDAMRLIVGGHTEADRPLTTNGYLAGIVWHRAGVGTAGGVSAPAVPAAPPARDTLPTPHLERAHLRADLAALRAMLQGAHTTSAQESLHRQIATAEARLAQATGDHDGLGE